MPQHAHAIEPGQIQIQNDQVIIRLAAHGARLLAILRHLHRVVLALQALAHKAGQRRVIFRNQNSHK
jgi:hypothetical protein